MDVVVAARRTKERRRLAFLGAVVEREQIERLDALAARDRRSRSGMLRVVIDVGMQALTAAQAAAR